MKPEYKFPFFCCAGWREAKEEKDLERGMGHGSGFWFRIFWGYGLHFTNGRKLFSERNGYEKRLHLPFGWRVKIIKKGSY
jgi:hypothetical protein